MSYTEEFINKQIDLLTKGCNDFFSDEEMDLYTEILTLKQEKGNFDAVKTKPSNNRG